LHIAFKYLWLPNLRVVADIGTYPGISPLESGIEFDSGKKFNLALFLQTPHMDILPQNLSNSVPANFSCDRQYFNVLRTHPISHIIFIAKRRLADVDDAIGRFPGKPSGKLQDLFTRDDQNQRLKASRLSS
jgi:hypothetical protein